MKYILFILFPIFITTACVSPKGKLEKQKGFKYQRMSELDSLNISEPNFKTDELVLRIYYSSFSFESPNSNILIITKNKDGSWKGFKYIYYFYNMNNYDFKNVSIKSLYFPNSWGNTWHEIIEKNYLNLPTESDIKFIDNHTRLVPAGGEEYIIEVITPKVKRLIFYGAPKSKYKYYLELGYNYNEYKQFIDFIDLLEQNFDLKSFE